MKQEFDYIDSYFRGLLNDEEMKIFDQRIIHEPEFAEEVAFYLNVHTAARDLAYEEKMNRFRQLPANEFRRKAVIKSWMSYAMAAAVIGAVALIAVFYFSTPSPQGLAQEYVEKHLVDLGVQMNTSADSVQRALNLYNTGKFDQSLKIYEEIIQNNPGNNDAIKYAGIASLRLKQYDKALQYFQRLVDMLLRANPGKFYSAITLMERNQPGDLAEAKKLLQEVVADDLEGSDVAKKWLKEW
jgi:tetratricopeptide (TPR) repeat protein